jgi:hypothetical protein
VSSFWASPDKEQINYRKSAGAERCTSRIAMLEIAEAEIAAGYGDLALIELKHEAEGALEGVLDGLLQKKQVRRAETVVLVASERECAVDVLAA